MRTYAQALFVATLAVASADAAEVSTAAQSVEVCATLAVPTAVIEAAQATGRMPVRGMNHFAAIYARSPASAGESTADAGDEAAVIARVDGPRS
jgi:hypothetical protein